MASLIFAEILPETPRSQLGPISKLMQKGASMRLSIITGCAIALVSSGAMAAGPKTTTGQGSAAAATTATPDVTGEWLVEDGNAKVRIDNCGGAMWGVVSWEKTPGGTDAQNPDPSKRTRPTLGLPILLNMQA